MICEELMSISNSTVLLSDMLKYAAFSFQSRTQDTSLSRYSTQSSPSASPCSECRADQISTQIPPHSGLHALSLRTDETVAEFVGESCHRPSASVNRSTPSPGSSRLGSSALGRFPLQCRKATTNLRLRMHECWEQGFT